MKVKISPYRNGIRSYKYLEKLDKLIGEDRVDRLYDIVQPILDSTINRILDRPRSVKVTLHPHDTIEGGKTLAYVILPVLKKYRETALGHEPPFVDDSDVPVEVTGAEEMWAWVLDEMIWAFEQCTIEWEDQYSSGNWDMHSVPVDPNNPNGLTKIMRGPNHTHKIDEIGIAKHVKRMENGFRLFGRYYLSLWR